MESSEWRDDGLDGEERNGTEGTDRSMTEDEAATQRSGRLLDPGAILALLEHELLASHRSSPHILDVVAHGPAVRSMMSAICW